MKLNKWKPFKNFMIFLTALALSFSYGCAKSTGSNTESKAAIENNAEAEWTVLIYMCGSSLESRSGQATKNIEEMLAANLSANANVILQTGGASAWQTAQISAMSTDRYEIKDQTLTLIERSSQRENFGESSTLSDFIQFGLENYPAEHTALILWDHGGGSVKGVCMDENFGNDYLTLSELGTALSDADLPKKLDFIGFDACLMADYETALTVSPYAKNLVASQEKEPSGGWDYQSLLENLGSDSLYENMLNAFAKKSEKKEYYTLSVFDLSGMELISSMVSKLCDQMEKDGNRQLITALSESLAYGSSGSGLFDLGNLFDFYGLEDEWQSYFSTVVSTLRSTASGISIYFPLYDQEGLENYLEICPDDEYRDFLSAFGAQTDTTLQFENYAMENEGKLAFTLSEESLENFAKTEVYLLQISEDGEQAYLLGTDDGYTLEDTTVTSAFEAVWVELNGSLLSCILVDQNEGVNIYQAPVQINDQKALLLFSLEEDGMTTSIIGAAYAADDYGRIYPVEAGDEIIIARRVYSEEGYILDYSINSPFTYTDQKVTTCLLPDGKYQFTIFAFDIYGNRYTTGTAVVTVTEGIMSYDLITADAPEYPELD